MDGVIAFLKALIALLRAASFFSGGASAAYAQYLETVVVPWMQKISMALGLFAKVLNANAEAQDQASNGETVDAGSLPTYTSQVSGDTSVTPYQGAPIAPTTQSAALGQIAQIANHALQGGQGGGSTAAPGGVDGTASAPAAGTPVTAGGIPVTAGGVPVTVGGTPLTTGGATSGALGTSSIGGPSSLGTGLGTGGIGTDGTMAQHHALAPAVGPDLVNESGRTGGGGGAPSGGGGGGSLGSSSIDAGAGHSGAAGGPGHDSGITSAGNPGVFSTDGSSGIGAGSPGSEALGAQSSPLAGAERVGSEQSGTSYGAAAGIGAGAAALGVGGAALAATKGAGGGDTRIDSIASGNGRGSSGGDVRELQQRLTDAGYDTHGVDGQWGGNTEKAYQAYREAHPLPVRAGTGYSSPDGFDYQQVTGVRGNEHVTPEFLRGVEGVAQRVGAKPEHLLAAMSFETGGSFRPDIVNPRSGATGLIQFMPDTAAGYGVSTQELAKMTPTEQLPYVEQYLERFRGRVGDVPSLYSSILGGHPMPSEQVMFEPGTAEYRQNRELDADGRGGITVREAADQIDRRLAGRR